jgi:hypothetical protein
VEECAGCELRGATPPVLELSPGSWRYDESNPN